MQTTTQTTVTAASTESSLPHDLEPRNLSAEEIDLAKKVISGTTASTGNDPDNQKMTPEQVAQVKEVFKEIEATASEAEAESAATPSNPADNKETPKVNVTGIAVETTTTEGSFFTRHRKALLIGGGTIAGIAGLYLIGAHTAAGQKTVEFLATKAKMAIGAVGSLIGSGEKAPETADAEAASEGIEAPAIEEAGSLNPADVANPAGDAQEIASEAAQTLGEGSEEAVAAQDVANSYK